MEYNSKRFESADYVNTILKKLDNHLQVLRTEQKRILEDIKEDFVAIKETELVNESNKTIQLYNKYSMLYVEKKPLLIKWQRQLEEMEAHLFDYYRYNYDISSKMTDSSANKYVHAHPIYTNLQILIDEMSNYLELIGRSLQYCDKRGYAVKNIIEIQKMQFGMMK